MEIQTPKTNQLRKVLGVAFGLAVVVGSTIGVGILRTPGTIATLIPNATLIMCCWVSIGLYIILAASSYAELTTMFPKAGGAYNYIKIAFGNYLGFVNGWFDFLTNAIAPAYFCIVLSEYSILMFPELASTKTTIAVSFLTFFTAINLPGIKSGSFIQKITSAIKVVLFLILIIGCFLFQPTGQIPVQQTMITGGLMLGIFKALQLIMGTYDGWMSVSFFAEEDNNPNKNIPKSYLLGALTIGLLYVLINGAILYVLPIEAIAKSPLAASDAANAAFGGWSGTLMTAVAIFSLVSILNAYMMIPSRILFGLGRDGFFIKQSTIVNQGGTPYYSLIMCYVFALVLTVSSSFEQLFGLATIMMTLVTGFAFASLIRLRHTQPDFPRPYKTFGYPFTSYLALAVTIALFIAFAVSDVVSLSIMVVIMALSYPAYKLFVKPNNNDTFD
ncbi:APC family permease [Flavobacterium sp.]|uniref:APC family permease n=1 Tax=Flavobacterium sp. TaxID=239 RepID=UPI00286A924A|nr:APC family permease [Flavobacterium sp.]